MKTTFQILAEHREKDPPSPPPQKVPVKNFDVMEKLLLEVPIETYVFFLVKFPAIDGKMKFAPCAT